MGSTNNIMKIMESNFYDVLGLDKKSNINDIKKS